PNGTIRVLVEGLKRAEIIEFLNDDQHFSVKVKVHEESESKDVEAQALMRTLLEYFEQYIKVSKKISAETYTSVVDIEEPG
ncbi:endopeptidase La, partial [Pseudomonas sp. MPR-R5A]